MAAILLRFFHVQSHNSDMSQLISFNVCYKDIDLCHTYASQFISRYSTAASVTISSCPELLFIDTHEITSGDYVIDNDLFFLLSL